MNAKLSKKVGSAGAALLLIGLFAPLINIVVSSMIVMAIGFLMLLICLVGTVVDKISTISEDNSDRFLIAGLSALADLFSHLAEALGLAAIGHMLAAGGASAPILIATTLPGAVVFALIAVALFAIVEKVLAK